jgi:hypothetical protein
MFNSERTIVVCLFFYQYAVRRRAEGGNEYVSKVSARAPREFLPSLSGCERLRNDLLILADPDFREMSIARMW